MRTMRRRRGKNTAGQKRRRLGRHAAADLVPVRWSSDFNRTPLYTRVQLTICTLSSNLRQTLRNVGACLLSEMTDSMRSFPIPEHSKSISALFQPSDT